MEQKENDFFNLLKTYFLKDIAVANFLIRFSLAILLFTMMLNYSPYHPSFFDQFSAVNQPGYIFGVPGALFISIFFDWCGLASYLIPVFLLLVSFQRSFFYKTIFLSIVMIFCIITFFSILIDHSGIVVRMFGALGYSAAKLASINVFFKIFVLFILSGALVSLSINLRIYKDIGLFCYRCMSLIYFFIHFYVSKLFKKPQLNFFIEDKHTDTFSNQD